MGAVRKNVQMASEAQHGEQGKCKNERETGSGVLSRRLRERLRELGGGQESQNNDGENGDE